MILYKQIKNSIERKFNIIFDVKPNISNGIEEYLIVPTDSNKNYFHLVATVKDESRLTIICEPDKYGANFLRFINLSNLEQRKIFVSYWKALSEKFKILVKINEQSYSPDDFLYDNKEWKQFSIRITSPLFYDNEKEKKNDSVCLYINLVLGMVFALLNYNVFFKEEGSETMVQHKKYERSSSNRELCLYLNGYKCSVCGFDFEKKYGELGKDFIEVHHIVPISQLGKNYKLNPIEDLIPLCSNCHSMIHRKNPPFLPDELKKIIDEEK